MEIKKLCECCKKEFIAKTTVTRFCSHSCACKSYKERKKQKKIGWVIEKTNTQKILDSKDLHLEKIKQRDFLSINDASTLLGVSERTLYRLLKSGMIKPVKIGSRTIIRRSEIDRL